MDSRFYAAMQSETFLEMKEQNEQADARLPRNCLRSM